MNWFLVPQIRPKPTVGTYQDWKDAIAANCRRQCVYCTISEGEYGGLDNFHVEHFRPKSVFQHFENEIDNLFIACAICNRFKSDEWPGEPHPQGSTATFLDPSVADYHAHIGVGSNAALQGKTPAGIFIVERLFLNREQLIISRRYRRALALLATATASFAASMDQLAALGSSGNSIILEITKASLRINQLQTQLVDAKPYRVTQTRRPRRAMKKNVSKSKPTTSRKRK